MKRNLLLLLLILLVHVPPCKAMEEENVSSEMRDTLRLCVAATLQYVCKLNSDVPSLPTTGNYTAAQFDATSEIVSAIGIDAKDKKKLRIESWHTEGGKCAHTQPISSIILPGELPVPQRKVPGITPLAFKSSHPLLAAGAPDGTVVLFDVTNPADKVILRTGELCSALAYTPDDQKLITALTDGSIKVWDVDAREVVKEMLQVPTRVNCIACDARNARCAIGFDDGSISVWDLANYKEIKVIKFSKEGFGVKSLTFNAEGSELAVGCADGALYRFNMKTYSVDTLAEGHPGSLSGTAQQLLALAIVALAYNPQKAELMSITGAPVVTMWNLDTNEPISIISLLSDLALRATISPDCTKVAIAPNTCQFEAHVYNVELARKLVSPGLLALDEMRVLKEVLTPALLQELHEFQNFSLGCKKVKEIALLILDAFNNLPKADQQLLQNMGFKRAS